MGSIEGVLLEPMILGFRVRGCKGSVGFPGVCQGLGLGRRGFRFQGFSRLWA